jgi:hypothetical protein
MVNESIIIKAEVCRTKSSKPNQMKNNFTLLTVLIMNCFALNHVAAQAPAIQWQKNFGGSASDYAYSIIPTADGGYVTAGKSNSSDFDVTGNHGSNDCWVIKMNSSGLIDWQKSYGGSGDDGAYTIRQTPDGGYILGAYSFSADGDVTVNKGGQDLWIVKLDMDGNIQWQKSYGGSEDDTPFSICLTTDGGYVIAGSSYSSDSDLTVNNGALDVWVLKIDSIGTLQWQKSFGGADYDYAATILQTPDGGYIVAGGAGSNGGDVTGCHGGGDAWVIRLDAAANVQWKKCYGGTGYDDCYSFISTNDGGFLICGVCSANNGDVTGNHGGQDEWLVKIDSAGMIQWQQSFGGTGNETGNAVIQIADGGFATCASTTSTNGQVSGNHGGRDAWFLSIDSAGNVASSKCYGGSFNEDAWSMIQTSDGGFIFAGESLSANGDVLANYGGEDIMVMKLDAVTRVSEINIPAGSFDVFPNPASASIVADYKIEKTETVTITLCDVRGKIICRQTPMGTAGENTLKIDLSNVTSGMYLLNLKCGGVSLNRKLVIQ